VKRFLNKNLPVVLAILIAAGALVAVGIAGYRWYRILSHDSVPTAPLFTISTTSPGEFSSDLASILENVVKPLGIDLKAIATRPADDADGSINSVYTVQVPKNLSLTLVNFHLTTAVRERGGEIMRGIEGKGGRSVTLTLGVRSRPTDIVILQRHRVELARKPRIAIIVDDLGIKDLKYARRLCVLEQTVTLAVLPFQRYTEEIVRLARDTDTPYILHMPMEPTSAGANPGEGALMVDDDPDTVKRKLARAFASVPGVHGINNHMGSRATEDIRIMDAVMAYLAVERHFFIDSRTSNNTEGYAASQRAGVQSAKINGYIDVEADTAFIEGRIEELAQEAKLHGSAILLGHDRPTTVEVLERKLPELAARGFIFVPVSELVR
jgi:uncharacterized protein